MVAEPAPPTLMAAKLPGLQCAANSLTESTTWLYAPIFLFEIISAEIGWAQLLIIVRPTFASSVATSRTYRDYADL